MATISPIFNGESAEDGVNKINAGFAKLNQLDEAEGNIYQGEGTGIEALSREDFGKQIEVLQDSFVGQNLDALNIHSFGRFQVGVTESNNGKTYTTIGDYSTMVLNANGFFSINLSAFLLPSGLEYTTFALIKDTDNYYAIRITRETVVFCKVVAGVETVLLSQSIGLNLLRSLRYQAEGAIQVDTSNVALNFYLFTPFYGVLKLNTSVVDIPRADLNKVGIGSNKTNINTSKDAINYTIYNS